MKLDVFLNKNNITLNPDILTLSKLGLQFMSKAKDKSHGKEHVYHILENLDYLIIKNKQIKSKINFNILIPAICWHDTWICNQEAKNVLQIIYFQIVEGYKSSILFKNAAKNTSLDKLTISLISYVIRKHSSVQLIPAFLLEAKILFDLDKIELWNYKRFIELGTDLVGKKEFYQKYVVRFYYTYSEKMGLYFNELEKVFKKKTKNFWRNVLN